MTHRWRHYNGGKSGGWSTCSDATIPTISTRTILTFLGETFPMLAVWCIWNDHTSKTSTRFMMTSSNRNILIYIGPLGTYAKFRPFDLGSNMLILYAFAYMLLRVETRTFCAQLCICRRAQFKLGQDVFTRWDWDKMADIFPDIFQGHFLEWNYLNFHRSFFLRVQVIILQHWFR